MSLREKLPLSEKAKNHFCPLPFLQMTLKTEGEICPCCLQQDYILGRIQTQNISEIWNAKPMKELREEFLSGEIKTCKNRIDQLSCHKNYERFLPDIDFVPEQTKLPVRLDLRLDHRCNLRCIMCDLHLHPDSPYHEDNFWQDLRKMAPGLNEIEILGGEPFFQKITTQLIDEVTRINSHCLWTITTNLNFDFSSVVKPLLDKIPLRTITVSIDSFDEDTYKHIRRGGDLQLLKKSLFELIDYRKSRSGTTLGGFKITGSMCVLNNNWREVPSFIDTCLEVGIHPCLIYVVYPPQLSINNLSQVEKENILSYLLDFCDEKRTSYIRRILWGIQHGLDYLSE